MMRFVLAATLSSNYGIYGPAFELCELTPRERGMLRAIERATRQPIEPMELPSVETVNEQRVSRFLGKISDALGTGDLQLFRDIIERYEREKNVPAIEIAAALAKLVQGENPLLLAR
jgi:ATP-dependent RNA helicase DeaD